MVSNLVYSHSITVICHTTPHPKFQTEHHGNDGIEHQYIMYIIQLFSETMGCTHGLYNCNYLLYVCSITMLVVRSVACTISRATHSLCHWSCHLSGVLLVGHLSPTLSVVPPVAPSVMLPVALLVMLPVTPLVTPPVAPPVACTISCATRCPHYLLRRWSCYLLRRWSHHLLLHLSRAPSVVPLIAH